MTDMKTEPMTAEELRFVAETWREQGCNNYAAEFERLADLIDQPADRREAVIREIQRVQHRDNHEEACDVADRILAAIEQETAAIRADERERLAKKAEDVNFDGYRLASWIRSQGEE